MYAKLAYLLPVLLALSSSFANGEDRFVQVKREAVAAGTVGEACNNKTSDGFRNATLHGHCAGRQGWWRHKAANNLAGDAKAEATAVPVATAPDVFDENNVQQNAASLNLDRTRKPVTVTLARTRSRTSTTLASTRISTSTTSTSMASSVKPSSSSASSPSTPSAAAPSGGSGAAPNAWSQGILDAHNTARASHGASKLVWSEDLTAAAKVWADKCIFQHGGTSGIAGGAGQNLAASGSSGSTASQSGQAVTDMWMGEEKDYNPSSPVYSHFTQVVWKGTSELGCYQSSCAGANFKNSDGTTVWNPTDIKSAVFTVCNYRKPGNVQGQFAANVQKN